MAKRKNRFMKKLKLNFVEDNGNEFQMFLDSSISVPRIRDIHSKFLNVDCEKFSYYHGNRKLISADEHSLKDLHIKNNDIIKVSYLLPSYTYRDLPSTLSFNEPLTDANIQSQCFILSQSLIDIIEFSLGDKYCGNYDWSLETRATFQKLLELVTELQKGMKNALTNEIGNCLVLRKDDQNKCLTLPHLVLDKIVTSMIHNSITKHERLLAYDGDGEEYRRVEMMKEAFKFMRVFYFEINVDLRLMLINSYPPRTMLMFSEQTKNPIILDVLKYFGVHDFSFQISTKVIDYIMSISLPEVTVDFVKKSRRSSQIPFVIHVNDVAVKKSYANEIINESLKEVEAIKVIPVLEIE